MLLMFLVSYAQACWRNPGIVSAEVHQWIALYHPTCPRDMTCNRMKPPRAHFDSVTRQLVLGMDHYCPFLVNTIGFYNRKFFVLVLCWGAVASAWVLGGSILRGFFDGGVAFTLAMVLNGVVCVVLVAFGGMHLKFCMFNQSTIGSQQDSKYDVGVMQNLKQVFGPSYWEWPFPLGQPQGDGIHWPLARTTSTRGLEP
eukprot:TRINITY_DN3648_c0_g1_i4.p1 TRINITY_DN3648_c0_g1~~TRINITY_DN3648_c0_g1_i4.p1  ORF type:complete len:198 (-),score=22.00 TRINITY_DN3648_c0_g1_i4:159-752(-)